MVDLVPEPAGLAGQRIRERRLDLDLTIQQAARIAEVSDTTWTNLEHGLPVRERSRRKILRVLGWSSADYGAMLGGEEPEPGQPIGLEPNLDDRVSALEARFDRVETVLRRLAGDEQ